MVGTSMIDVELTDSRTFSESIREVVDGLKFPHFVNPCIRLYCSAPFGSLYLIKFYI